MDTNHDSETGQEGMLNQCNDNNNFLATNLPIDIEGIREISEFHLKDFSVSVTFSQNHDYFLNLNGIKFKAVLREPANENEFQVGSCTNDTAVNLAKAIQNCTNPKITKYEVHGDWSGAKVHFKELAQGYEKQYININRDIGPIYKNPEEIAGFSDMNVYLKTTNHESKEVVDFIVENIENTADVKFIAKIKDSGGNIEEFTKTVAAPNICALNKGFKLDLTSSKTNDSLSINLGSNGLQCLTNDENIPTINKAFKAIFLKD